jgi:signal transduction histidine kinase
MMFKKLRNKMLAFNVISISIIIIMAFSVVYIVTSSNAEQENRRQLRAISAIPLMPNRPVPNDEPFRFAPDYRVSFVLFTSGRVLENVYSHLTFDYPVYEEALKKTNGKLSGKIYLNSRRWAFYATEAPAPNESQYEKIVFLDITSDTKTLRTLLITLSCTGLAVLLGVLWFGYRFAVSAVRPIEESYNKQKRFVADASHEFKTPLAIISANIDAIESSSQDSVESQKEWFGYIRLELQRTAKLVDNLLYLAKAEDESLASATSFDLSNACETACASMEAILYDNGITLSASFQENIIIHSNSEKVTQVLYILLDNAGKYTPRGGLIHFSLNLEQDQAKVQISNTGPGIAAEDIPKIFDRFYRPDASRSQETGGFGLGLSIAKTIVERLKGELTAKSGKDMTTFTLKLRLEQAKSSKLF